MSPKSNKSSFSVHTNHEICNDQGTKSTESDNNENEEILAYFTKFLSVSTVIHTSVPIEYPRTSPNGVATIYLVLSSLYIITNK